MPAGLGLRFALEVAFLVAAAVVAALLKLGWPAIVAVMSAAWIATTAIEWRFSRAAASAQAPIPLPAAAPAGEGIVVVRQARRDDEPGPGTEWVEDETRLPPVRAAEPEIPVHVRVLPRAAAPAAAEEPEPAAAEEPEPAAEEAPEAATMEPGAEPEAVEVPTPLVAVPSPPPEPVAVAPAPAPPEPDRVVAFPAAAHAPQRWNVWELERLTRARAGTDPGRDEELGFLLVYLRDFALADGSLPEEFDDLVRESFGHVVGAAASR